MPLPSSSSESDISELVGNPGNELQFIAEEVSAAPVILEKSQIPQIKQRKDEAIQSLTKKYGATFGKPLDAKGLLKKINNMKARLKKKTDLNKTGNKAIKLLDWEKKLLKALEGDSNPTIVRIEGAMQIGFDQHGSTQHTESGTSTSQGVRHASSEKESRYSEESVTSITAVQSLPPKKNLATEKYETDETRGLTTKELQRLVLLQQYNATKVQKEYYEKKLEMMQCKESTPETLVDGDKTYFKL